MRSAALALVLVLVAACRSASGPVPEREAARIAERACPRVVQPYLFEIELDGRVSHLFGTRHAGVSLGKLPPVVRDQLDAAEVVIVESVLDDAPPPRRAEDLADALGATDWARYRTLVGPALADRMNHESPGIALAALATLYEDRSVLLDREIQDVARTRGQRLLALETAARSEELAGRMLGLDALRAAIDAAPSREAIARSTEDDLAAYCRGEPPGPAFASDAVTDERNLAWLPALNDAFAASRTFVAVGSKHLFGPGGLIALLRKDGYRVENVRP